MLALGAPMPPAAAPSQLLVLGMHHSGTSVVSNLTMMMGAFGGAHDDLLLHPENPLKFWERRDVVALDEQRLGEGVQSKVASRYEVPEWVAYGFDTAKPVSARIHESSEAKGIVEKLNAQRPWVTKDPRMCLVAEEWMPLLDAPLCLIVHREPLSVANSMMIYSHNVSLAEWASVYESYYTNALRACHGVRAFLLFSIRPYSTSHAHTHTDGWSPPPRPSLPLAARPPSPSPATHTRMQIKEHTPLTHPSLPLTFILSHKPPSSSFPLCRSRRSSSSTPNSSPTRTRPCASSTPTSPPPASLASPCPPRAR